MRRAHIECKYVTDDRQRLSEKDQASTTDPIALLRLKACLKTPCSAAAVDFGGGQGGEAARIPAAGFDGRANTGIRQKTRRPQGISLIILAYFSRLWINDLHLYAVSFQFGYAQVNVLKTALHAVFRQALSHTKPICATAALVALISRWRFIHKAS